MKLDCLNGLTAMYIDRNVYVNPRSILDDLSWQTQTEGKLWYYCINLYLYGFMNLFGSLKNDQVMFFIFNNIFRFCLFLYFDMIVVFAVFS